MTGTPAYNNITPGSMTGTVSAPVNYGGFNMGTYAPSGASTFGSRPTNSVDTCNPVAPVPNAIP